MENEHNENFIKNLAEDYKNILDEKDKQLKLVGRKHNNLFKILCVLYSILRQLDMAFSKMDFPEHTLFKGIHDMIEFGRSEASAALHQYLPEEDSDSEEL